MTNRREALESSMRKATEQYGEAAARMAEDNGALLREYEECLQEIDARETRGMPVPEEYRESFAELRDEIERRMNRGAGNGL